MATKKIRILSGFPLGVAQYRPNQVVSMDAALAKALIKDGLADDSKAGIDYCLNELGVQVLEHESVGFDADAEARAVADAQAKEAAEKAAAEKAAEEAARAQADQQAQLQV